MVFHNRLVEECGIRGPLYLGLLRYRFVDGGAKVSHRLGFPHIHRPYYDNYIQLILISEVRDNIEFKESQNNCQKASISLARYIVPIRS
jgi:hypothetical protein